jgi:hypothetical protein
MTSPRLAEYCTRDACADLRVNGDRVSFVSVEQLRRYGWSSATAEHAAQFREGMSSAERERQLPADVKSIPRSYVLAHDANGVVLPRCELYVLRWTRGGTTGPASAQDLRAAERYFGTRRVTRGTVDIPRGPWRRLCKVAVIRYHRDAGPTPHHVGDFEHPYEFQYEEPVWLSSCRSPLAFRLALPDGCIITTHGFERP